MIRRSLRFLLRLTAGLVLATLVLIGLAVWRVASGPVSLTFLTPTLAGPLDAALDAAGHLQMVFPTGGNLSEAIVAEVLKAAAVPAPQPRPTDGETQPRRTALAH